MKKRTGKVSRKTKETDIKVEINLDGSGKYEIDTGIGFIDHMLAHLSKHSKIDIKLKAKGDLEVDAHHTVEDVGICLGQCILEALGDKRGIKRYGDSSVPMEDALANTAVDLSGRAGFAYNVNYNTEKIGELDTECLEEMLKSLSSSGKFNLHINVPYGSNSHHIAEAVFKSVGLAMQRAVRISGDEVPSTKGKL
jgi:imidazoleglycerol-phosphate dehydratase